MGNEKQLQYKLRESDLLWFEEFLPPYSWKQVLPELKLESNACRNVFRYQGSCRGQWAIIHRSPWTEGFQNSCRSLEYHYGNLCLTSRKTKGSNNPWTRCKPNVQKSIKSTMKPKCFSVQTCHGRRTICFPLVTKGGQRRGPQWCVTSINIPNQQRQFVHCWFFWELITEDNIQREGLPERYQ